MLSASISGALLGFAWATSMGYWYTSWQLDKDIFNQNVIIEGRVSSITSVEHQTLNDKGNKLPQSIRFNMQLDKVGKYDLWHAPRVRITWYQPAQLPKQGHRFRLLVSLKAPSGLANPYTFHYQTWLASKNIVATGYVINSISNYQLSQQSSLRQQSIDNLGQMELQHNAWLQALSFGYRGQLSDSDWELLQGSGTAHLFAISGLHVGIVFAYCILLFGKPLALAASCIVGQWQVNKISTAVATAICLIYAYLAGFEVPVLRAILALVLWSYLLLTNAHWRLPAVLLYLVVSFFILFPYSILGISFWFSFTAVISIWLFVWRFMPRGKLSLWGKIKSGFYLQVWLCVITMPITLYVFGQLPVLSLFANLILVPWVSFVLVPLCLLGSFALLIGFPSSLVLSIYSLADSAMRFTHYIMDLTVNAANSIPFQAIALDASAIAIMTLMLLLLLLPFWRYRKRLLLLCVCALIARGHASHHPYPTLTVFDVGQGSAAMFRFTDNKGQKRVWLFDTGARFRSGFSMAQGVIMPTLEHYKIAQIDAVFLSHLDNDHAGGIDFLRANVGLTNVLSPKNMCDVKAIQLAQLQQVNITLEVLWPLTAESGDENNHSCVIKLQVAGQSILFAGDIEAEAERAIVALDNGSGALASHILIAPHHGSVSSSTKPFVEAVWPQYVVFSAAHPNRWGFPHAQVLARYQAIDSRILHTGKQGAIEFVFKPTRVKVSTYRDDTYARWYFKAMN